MHQNEHSRQDTWCALNVLNGLKSGFGIPVTITNGDWRWRREG